MANPKIFNSPKINFLLKIVQSFIEQIKDPNIIPWINGYLSAKRHQFLEKYLTQENHLLNLNKYILQNVQESENNKDLTDSLKQLKTFKSGAITKEEFKKAKEIRF